MTNSRKKGELSKTTKSYLELWLKEQLYGRRKEIKSKYMDKGVLMEDNAIDFAAENMGLFLLKKNEENFKNDFFSGTPDVIQKDFIIDTKCSWDFSGFPLFEKEIPNKDYYYQGQIYMDLVGLDTFKLVYCLMDTPEHLIQSEARMYCHRTGYDIEDVIEKFKKKMTFSDLDPKLRIKIFEFKKDETVIQQIKDRVIECRNYIETLNQSIK
tara:strand:+ start:4996 stop:5628 length:633 start_codon:yes stop_codon:yes gene_type:complete